MKVFNKFLSVALSLVVVFACFAVVPVKAITYPVMGEISSSSGKASIYSLPGTPGHETAGNKNESKWLCDLANGTTIKILGSEADGDGDIWYKINYGNNFENTGYAFSARVSIKYDYVYDEAFENSLKDFPESYHEALRSLHAKYPKWQFIAHNINIDLETAVDMQYSPSDVSKRKKMVELTYGGNEWRDMRSYNAATDTWTQTYSGWTYASRDAIAYFVDPRNYLTERYVFAFLEQSYNKSLQTKEGLRTVVANTFLSKGYNNDADAYLDDLILAAEQSGVSPYVLAAAIILEVGVNGSTVTSGTYPGYEGYYNFYNWNATGNDVIGNALKFAKEKGWNSREAAIVGGAKLYADGYVSVGQDTYYYKNFNYVTSQSVDHQYAESVYATRGDATRISVAFIDNTSGTATFKIPVFENMGDRANTVPCVGHTYTNDCDESCDFCGRIRAVPHKYSNDCDTNCNICGATRTASAHVYDNNQDTTCNICGAVRSLSDVPDSWSIRVDNTGVYDLSPSSGFSGSFSMQDIIVLDTQSKEVNYYEKLDGFPLVAGHNYIIKFKTNCSDKITGSISWKKTIKADTIFPDTSASQWYNEPITYVVGRGIMTGYGDTGYFGTADGIQRQDFLVMLARYEGVDLTLYEKKSKFPDVTEDSYYKAAINWGAENGIVTGYVNGKFGVGDKITREQIVTFIYRYANYKGIDVSYSDITKQNVSKLYTDFKYVNDYAYAPVLWAIENGVIKGKTESTIAPSGNTLRCEIAQIMYNIFVNDIL